MFQAADFGGVRYGGSAIPSVIACGMEARPQVEGGPRRVGRRSRCRMSSWGNFRVRFSHGRRGLAILSSAHASACTKAIQRKPRKKKIPEITEPTQRRKAMPRVIFSPEVRIARSPKSLFPSFWPTVPVEPDEVNRSHKKCRDEVRAMDIPRRNDRSRRYSSRRSHGDQKKDQRNEAEDGPSRPRRPIHASRSHRIPYLSYRPRDRRAHPSRIGRMAMTATAPYPPVPIVRAH